MLLNNRSYTLDHVSHDPFKKTAPTTEAQKEIFASINIGGDAASCAYNESITLNFSGPLNVSQLNQCIVQLQERHDSLRLTFDLNGENFIIHEKPLTNLIVIENHLQSETDNRNYLDVLKTSETTSAFDLINGPLIRFTLIKSNENTHHLIITAHHIICDGWSLSLMLNDLSVLYNSNEKNHLPPSLSFYNYAIKQNEYLKSISNKATELFWVEQYQTEVPSINYPTDHIRPKARTFNAERIDIPLPKSTIQNIRKLGTKNNCSFVSTMLSGFELFLSLVTSQEDIVVGLPAAGQNVAGLKNLVGHCVHLLPLKSKVSSHITVSDYLKQRKSYLFDAYDNQEFTFGSLISKLNIPRDASRIPLVPIVFNVDIGFTEGIHFNQLDYTFETNPRKYENFELFINASGSGDEMVLECTYNADLFNQIGVQNKFQQFIHVLDQICNNDQQPISNLSLLVKADIELYQSFNATLNDTNIDCSIFSLFKEQSLKHENNIAIKGGNKSYTYGEASYHITRIAALLQQKGIVAGNTIAISVHRTAELPLLLLAINACGAAYVPIDPSFPIDRRMIMIEDSKANFLMVSNDLAAEYNHIPYEKIILNDEFLFKQNGVSYTPVQTNGNSLAYVLFTSGSTGRPKGVMIKNKSVVNMLKHFQQEIEINSNDHLLALTTISFDISVLELFLPLSSGSSVTIARKEESVDPSKLLHLLNNDNITIVQATPATWEMIVATGWEGNSNIKILCGGEALKNHLGNILLTKCEKLWNVYGPTETTVWSSCLHITKEILQFNQHPTLSIGKPISNTKFYIVNKNNQLCPAHIEGELWIGGAGVGKGYIGNDTLTSERFIHNPFDEGMIYKTGDHAKFDENGMFYFNGRADGQVKIRGYRIELGEIENALCSIEFIENAVVLIKQNQLNEQYLSAWIQFKDNSVDNQILLQSIKSLLNKKVPDYMVPTHWTIIEQFPLTLNNKVDRKQLVENKNKNLQTEETHFSPIEKIIADVWKDLLETEQLHRSSDFFELGGHSILAVRMMVELERRTGIKLPLAVLFTNPTIEKLAVTYSIPQKEEVWRPLVKIKETGEQSPLYFAHGISGNVFKYHLLANSLHVNQPSYGLQAVGLNGVDHPFDDLVEMATYHVKELIKFQPQGPYKLAGGSFGGYLAYEMACQLQSLGHQVSFLCLMDIEAATSLDFLPSGVKQLKSAQLLAERFYKRAVNFIKSDYEAKQQYLMAKRKQHQSNNDIESWLDKHNVVEMIGVESAEYFKKVETACYTSLLNYKIKEYYGNVLLVRAKDGYFNNTYAEDLGWKNFVKGTLSIEHVEGDHNSIFWSPQVEDLVTVFNKYLSGNTR